MNPQEQHDRVQQQIHPLLQSYQRHGSAPNDGSKNATLQGQRQDTKRVAHFTPMAPGQVPVAAIHRSQPRPLRRSSSLRISSSLGQVTALCSFNFLYGLICGTMGLFVLPAEAQHLYKEYASFLLGISLGIVGLSQLICPLAGRISDLHKSESAMGKRAPYIAGSAVVAILATIGMMHGSFAVSPIAYYCWLFVGMCAINVIYSVQSGLVPDLCDDATQTRASGVVAVLSVSGSASGFIAVIGARKYDFHFVYPLYAILLLLTTCVSLLAGMEIEGRRRDITGEGRLSCMQMTCPYAAEPMPEENGPGFPLLTPPTSVNHAETPHDTFFGMPLLSCREMIACYTIDTSRSFDFFWVFTGRTFYYVAVSVQAFMFYYLRDVIGTVSVEMREAQIGTIALIAQGAAASLAYPMGVLSERTGRKPLIYAACAAMTVTYALFMAANWAGQYAFSLVLVAALLYGAGNGSFLSVDYGLAVATIPDKRNTAQSMGIWGVSAFIGSALGPMMWGSMVQWIGRKKQDHYEFHGYLAMLLGGIVFTILAGGVLSFVKGVD